MTRRNALIERAAAKQAGRVVVVDFAAYMAAEPGRLADRALRPEGLHFSPEGALALTED